MAWELKIENSVIPPFTEEAKEALKKQYPDIFYDLYKEI
jgi:hypothetical protein